MHPNRFRLRQYCIILTSLICLLLASCAVDTGDSDNDSVTDLSGFNADNTDTSTDTDASKTYSRGEVIESESLGTWDQATVKGKVSAAYEGFIDLYMTQTVEVVELVYGMQGPFDEVVKVSATVIYPTAHEESLPVVSYLHGTELERYFVDDSLEFSVIGPIMGSSGFFTVMPHYLGYEESGVMHPYVHAETEANAAIDAIRAARNYAAEKGINLTDDVFLTGYSQGGHATMATAKLIQEQHSAEFSLKAVAPAAGPYAMNSFKEPLAADEEVIAVNYYLPFLVVGYNYVYQFYENTSDFFLEDVATAVDGIFSGDRDQLSEYVDQIPSIPSELIQPEVLNAINTDPNHQLNLILAENDLTDWTPTMNMRLYHCEGDPVVLYSHSQTAYDQFIANGSTTVELYPQSGTDHAACAAPVLLEVRNWFLGTLSE